MSMIVHAEIVARRKLAPLPQGWVVCGWRQVDKDRLLISGGVARPMTLWSGLAGRLIEGELQSVLVLMDEVRAEIARYEAQTGKCGECMGSGRKSSERRMGRLFAGSPCPRCAGLKQASSQPCGATA